MVNYKTKILEERYGSLKFLLLLHEFGDMYYTEIAHKGMIDQTMDKTIEVLEKLQLIERYKNPEKHHRRIYHRLTENGKKIAENLSEIEKILSDVKINDL